MNDPSGQPQGDEVRRPRILLVTDRVPGLDSGYSMRVDNVVTGLGQIGDLHIALVDSTAGGIAFPSRPEYTTSVLRAMEPSYRRKLVTSPFALAQLPYRKQRRLREQLHIQLTSEPWDLIWFSRIRVYSIVGGVLPGPVIVDFDDLNDRLGESLRADRRGRRGRLAAAPRNLIDRLEQPRWRKIQRQIAKDVDRVVVCSEQDRAHLGLSNAEIVRNGVRPPRSMPRKPDPDKPTFMFVGTLAYAPNLFAVEWFAFEVLSKIRAVLPTAQFIVVGHDYGVRSKLRDVPGVTFTGYARGLDAYYESATAAVAPLHSGGGTRLKVCEALARSVPMVSTSFGCSGLHVEHDQHLLIADDPQEFADACIAITRSADLAARLTEAGRERYLTHHTSQATIDDIVALLGSVMRDRRSETTLA
jgi:polysaccharide biosynthesis protein PslH